MKSKPCSRGRNNFPCSASQSTTPTVTDTFWTHLWNIYSSIYLENTNDDVWIQKCRHFVRTKSIQPEKKYSAATIYFFTILPWLIDINDSSTKEACCVQTVSCLLDKLLLLNACRTGGSNVAVGPRDAKRKVKVWLITGYIYALLYYKQRERKFLGRTVRNMSRVYAERELQVCSLDNGQIFISA